MQSFIKQAYSRYLGYPAPSLFSIKPQLRIAVLQIINTPPDFASHAMHLTNPVESVVV
jgi:hypothetical protein